MITIHSSRLILAVLALAAMLVSSSHSSAQTLWIPTGATGAWATATNWNPATVPNGQGANANFSNPTLTANQTVDMGANRTLGTLTMGHSTFTQTISGAFTLTMDVSSGSNTITTNGNKASTISSNVALADATNLNVTSTGLFTMSGVRSGSGSLTKLGSGTVFFSTATNTATGNLTVSVGNIRGNVATSFGTGVAQLFANAGVIEGAASASTTFGRNTTVGGDTTFNSNRASSGAAVDYTYGTLSIGSFTLNTIRGSLATSLYAGIKFGATTLTGTATFAPAANSILTLASLTGGGTFNLNGPASSGILAIGGTGSYTGGTFNWTSGMLQLNSAAPLDAATTTVTFPAASGTLTNRLLINGGVTTAYNVSIGSGLYLNAAGYGLIEHANFHFAGSSGQARINGTVTFDSTTVSAGGTLVGGSGTGNELVFGGALNQVATTTSLVQRDGRIIYAGGGNIDGTLAVTGTAMVGAPNGLPPLLSDVLIANSASSTFDLNGFSQTVNGLTLGSPAQAHTATVTLGASVLSLNGNLTIQGSSPAHVINASTGGIAIIGGPRTFTVNDATAADDLTINNAFFTGGGIIKGGAGMLNLNGVASGSALSFDSGAVRGTFNANGGLTLNAATLDPGALLLNSTTGATLTATTFAIGGGGVLNMNIGTGGDVINVTNPDGFTVSGLTSVNVAGFVGVPLAIGNYNLITYTTTTTGPGVAGFILGPLTGRATGSLVDTGTVPGAGAIQLQITAIDTVTWTGITSNSWDTTTFDNFVITTPNTPTTFIDGDDAIFPSGASNTTIAIGAPGVSPIRVTFTNNGSTPYVITGTNPISGTGTMVMNGTGLVTLRNPNTFTGGVTVNNGTLELDLSTGMGSITAASGIAVNSPGTFRLSSANNDFTFNRAISGNGTVQIDPNASGTPDSRTVTISGTNTGFTGTFQLAPSGTLAGNGSFRTSSGTNQANLGSATVVMNDRAQLWYTGSLTNNLVLTGAGFSETAGGTNVVPSLSYSGIGAIRGINSTTLSGNILLNGTAKIGAYNSTTLSATLTLSGVITLTNATDLLVIGGSNMTSASQTIILTGDSPGLGDIWVNGGHNGATGTGSDIIQIGNNSTTGSLGSGTWNINLFGQPLRSAMARFNRADGYSLVAGQTITSTSASADLVRTRIEVNTSGSGLSINGTTIDLSDGANGGTMVLASSVGNVSLNLSGSALLDLGSLHLGESSGNSGTIDQNLGSTVNVINQLRIGHWPSETSVYNLMGGNVNITSASLATNPYQSGVLEINGGVYLGIDGTGVFNISGGTLNTNWIVLDNRGNTTGEDQLNLSGGTINLRSNWGIISSNSTTAFNWSGGTIFYDDSGTGVGTGAGLIFPINTPVTVTGTGATLNTNGAGNGFALNRNVLGSGTLNMIGGGTISLNPTSAQTIDAILSGTSPVTKLGTQTTTLNSASTYNGVTTVSAGRLNLVGSILNSDLTVATNAQISGEGSAKSLTLNGSSGTTVFFDPNTAGALTATNNLNVSGVITVDFSSAPPSAGPFTVISFGGTTAATISDFALANAGNYRPSTFNVLSNSVTLTLGSVTTVWVGGSGTPTLWDNNVTDNWTNGVDQRYFQNDFVVFNDTAASFDVATVGVITPGSTTYNNTTLYTLAVAGGSTFGGGGSFTKNNTGTVVVTGTLGHTGVTTVNDGILQLGNGTTASNLSSSTAVTIAAAGRLRLQSVGTTAMTVNMASLSGAGTLEGYAVGAGNGDVTVTTTGGAAGFTGSVLATAGRMIFGNVASVPTNATQFTVATGDGQFFLTQSGTIPAPFSITGFGWKESAGRLGAIRLSNTGLNISGAITLTGDARINATSNGAISGAINGGFNLEINKQATGGGNATITFTGTTGLTGNLHIPSGTLQVGDGGNTGDISSVAQIDFSALDVADLTLAATTGTLNFRRSDTVTFTKPILNGPTATQVTGVLTHSGIGTVTLTSNVFQLRGAINVTGADDNARLVLNPGGSGGAFNTFGPTASLGAIDPMTANLTYNSGADVEVKTSSDLQFDLLTSSTASSFFIHSGSGTITLGGATDNSSAKVIVSGGGTIVLAKASGSVVHAVASTTSSNVFGLDLLNGSTARLAGTGTDQIFTQSDVRLVAGTTFDFNGQSDGFDLLVGSGGTVTNTAALTTSTMTLGEHNSTIPTGSNNIFNGVIQDGTGLMALTKVGTGVQVLSGTNNYTGATAINAGTLSVAGSLGVTPVTITGTGNLAGAGTVNGPVVLNNATAAIRPGADSGNGTIANFTVASLDHQAGSIGLDLSNNPSGPGNDKLTVTGAYTYTGGTLDLLFATNPGAGTYTLLSYGTLPISLTDSAITINGLSIAAWNAGSSFDAGSVNNGSGTADSITLAFTATPRNLFWNGSSSSWNANLDTSFNETTPGGTATVFYNGDNVTFEDTSTPGLFLTATLNDVTVAPSSITFNNSSRDYVINHVGTGGIIGSTGITKNGTGTVTLGGANTYTGAIIVSNGTLKAASTQAFGRNSSITISSGGTIDLNGQSLANSATTGWGSSYFIAGTGVGGNGALTNTSSTGPASFAGILNLTLTADATISGIGRYDLGRVGATQQGILSGTINGGGFTLTKIGVNMVSIRAPATNISYIVNEGTLRGENDSGSLGNTMATVNAGATLDIYTGSTPISTPVALTLNDLSTIAVTTGTSGSTGTYSGNAVISGTVTVASLGATTVIGEMSGVISGSGSLTKNTSSMTLVLSGANTHSGTTRTNAGNLVLANSLALQNSTLDTQLGANGNTVFDQTVVSNAFTLGGLTGAKNLSLQNNAGTPAAVAVSVGNNNSSTTYAGALTGSGSLVKIGSGSLTLSGGNTYAGTTTITSGTLIVQSSLGLGNATVNGGTLRGTGTVDGATAVNSGGTIRGGNSIGTLTLGGSLTVGAGATVAIEIVDGSTSAAFSTGGSTTGTLPNPTSNNFLNILSGGASFDPAAQFTFDATGVSFTVDAPYSYQIMQGAGDQSALNFGAVNITPIGVNVNPLSLSITGNASGAVFLNFVPVPEPALMLVLAGVFGIARMRRR